MVVTTIVLTIVMQSPKSNTADQTLVAMTPQSILTPALPQCSMIKLRRFVDNSHSVFGDKEVFPKYCIVYF
jgi:hypothetical protein